MKITFLGTGTSQGIPVIACDCEACTSDDKHDNRLRTSIFIETEDLSILVDVGPDFRQQMLREKIKNLDAVLLTHEHNDHMIGADDLRPFNFMQKKDMPIYGEQRVLSEIKDRFKYAFIPHQYPGIPHFKLIPIKNDNSFSIDHLQITPIRVMHGRLPILGFRIGNFCYLTDVKSIPEQEFKKLEDLDYLVLSALRDKPHHAHLTLDEANTLASKINAKKTYLTHFSHDLGKVENWKKRLLPNIYPAFDGLQLIF